MASQKLLARTAEQGTPEWAIQYELDSLRLFVTVDQEVRQEQRLASPADQPATEAATEAAAAAPPDGDWDTYSKSLYAIILQSSAAELAEYGMSEAEIQNWLQKKDITLRRAITAAQERRCARGPAGPPPLPSPLPGSAADNNSDSA